MKNLMNFKCSWEKNSHGDHNFRYLLSLDKREERLKPIYEYHYNKKSQKSQGMIEC